MPTLQGHTASRSFFTVNGGVFFVFEFGGRVRTCHESNQHLEWEQA